MKPAPTPFPPNILNDDDFAFLPYSFASNFAPELMEFHPLEVLPENTVSNPAASPFDPKSLESRAADIVSELHELHKALRTSDSWYDGSFDLGTATSVFSAENLCIFAATYFRVSHLDLPIVHRPSFGTDRTTKPLLLAVGLSGCLRSPPSDDVLAARNFLSLGEEYVFRCLVRLIPPSTTPEFTHELIETLQAALMVSCIQFFRNDVATRRKSRAHRLPVLVSAMRCLELAQTRHEPIFDFDSFVRNESRIRLVAVSQFPAARS